MDSHAQCDRVLEVVRRLGVATAADIEGWFDEDGMTHRLASAHLCSLAQRGVLERCGERQYRSADGILGPPVAEYRLRGVRVGGRDPEQIVIGMYTAGQMTLREVAEATGMSLSRVFRVVKRAGIQGQPGRQGTKKQPPFAAPEDGQE